MVKSKYYSLAKIQKKNADYNIIFGERSNGKTYACLEMALRRYVETGEQTAYLRRWREDLRGKRGESLFSGHVNNGLIEKLTDGKFNSVLYFSSKWFLCYYDQEQNKRIPDDKPFCFGFALSEQEHEKSSSFPDVTTIIFDEFLTRRYYLPDEFILFMNLLSTIIRQRDNVKVYMLGNTVNKYCPYFSEMGLKKIPEMTQGTIDMYYFGDGGAIVAVEYTADTSSKKESNKYFCFDSPELQMITGGKWELAIYPHLPMKYKPKDVLLIYYIEFQDVVLQGNIIYKDGHDFTYIHPKTTPIKENNKNIVYSLKPDSRPNYKRRLLSHSNQLETRIASYYVREKVFYQSNEVGEVVRNYIITSQKNNVISV